MWNRPKKDITQLPPQSPHTPSPDGEGWEVNDGAISVTWMTQPRAPAQGSVAAVKYK